MDCVSGSSEAVQQPQRRFIRQDNFDLNLSEEEVLSDELLYRVSKDSEIKNMLQDPVYHRLLTRLDNARDRRQFFTRLFEKSPMFASLVERISEVMTTGDPLEKE